MCADMLSPALVRSWGPVFARACFDSEGITPGGLLGERALRRCVRRFNAFSFFTMTGTIARCVVAQSMGAAQWHQRVFAARHKAARS